MADAGYSRAVPKTAGEHPRSAVKHGLKKSKYIASLGFKSRLLSELPFNVLKIALCVNYDVAEY